MTSVSRIIPALLIIALRPAFAWADDQKPGFTPAGHTTDSLTTIRNRVTNGNAVLLDVREQPEWDAGHLKLARLLPLSIVREGDLTQAKKNLLPKGKPIYCHCRSGGRVLAVSKLLRAKGFDIRPLKAGYRELLKSGFEEAVSDGVTE